MRGTGQVALSAFILIIVVLGIPFGIWEHFFANCDSWWFKLMSAGDVPARCVIK